MWAEVVNVIAKALDTFDQEKVHEAIKADRDNITSEMSTCVPRPAVDRLHRQTLRRRLGPPDRPAGRGDAQAGGEQGLPGEAHELQLIGSTRGDR